MGRRRNKNLLTEFHKRASRIVTNKFPARCSDCGRDLAPGMGWAMRSPGDRKWDVSCKNGCKDEGPLINPQHDKWYTPEYDGDIDRHHSG